MIINVGNYEFTEFWDGILYKNLSDYPHVSDWEMKSMIEFIEYERSYGRTTELISADDELAARICKKLKKPERYANAALPEKITECTACKQHGCLTRLVCHTSSAEDAASILRSKTLLSAVRVRKLPSEVLRQEPRNSAGDPKDFFDYIMFAWGNCQAGDRLVMERAMRHFPTEEELNSEFMPGVRYYFDYSRLDKHPNAVHDGVHPIKIKDELYLPDYVKAIIIPDCVKEQLAGEIPPSLRSVTHFLEYSRENIWDWSEKVYDFVMSL